MKIPRVMTCLMASGLAVPMLLGCATGGGPAGAGAVQDGGPVAFESPRNSPTLSETGPSHEPELKHAGVTPSARPHSSGASPTPDDHPEGDSRSTLVVPTSLGELPVPRTGDDAVVLLDSMPDRLESWIALPVERGLVTYDHPTGPLMIEAGELADMYVRPVTAAEAIRRIRNDLDAGSAELCAAPPDRCVTGRMDGQVGVVWGHDDSEGLIAAVWPDDGARTALLTAWSALR